MVGERVGNACETAVGLFWLILAYSGLFWLILAYSTAPDKRYVFNELGSEAMTSCDIEL